MSKLPIYEHVVQYYETDQMAVVHHSNYIRWFEETRIFIFDKIGLGYKEMEDRGIISPVTSVTAEFKTMTKFYDTVAIEAKFTKFTGIRLYVEYTVRDKVTGEVRCTGKSEHCFISPEGKILSIKRSFPEVYETMMKYIEAEE